MIILYISSFIGVSFIGSHYTLDGEIDNYLFNVFIFLSRLFLFILIITIFFYYNIKARNFIFNRYIEKDASDKYPHSLLSTAIIGRVSLLFFIGLFVFYILEVSSRFLMPNISSFEIGYNISSVRKPFPYVMFKGRENAGVTRGDINLENMNENGYRGPAPTKIKPQGEVRIFVLGGSTVWNGYPTIPEVIEGNFRRSNHGNVKVFNYGVMASNSGMELARLVYEIVDYEPDIVIFYNGSNDVMHPLSADPRVGYPYNFMVWENNPLIQYDINKYPGFSLYLYNSNLLRVLMKSYFSNKLGKIDDLRESVGYNTKDWRSKTALNYLKNIEKTALISKAYNAQFIAFFQPMVYYKSTLKGKEINFVSKFESKHAIEMRKMILANIDTNKYNFKDFSNVFDKYNEELFIDLVHTNQRGIDIIGNEIYESIIKKFKIE